MTSFLGNENVQKALRQLDRRLRANEIDDLNKVLSTPEGRRFYSRLVYEMCNLEGLVFHGDIKDGVCAARHDAHREGQRLIGRVLVEEAQQHAPEAWRLAKSERDMKVVSDATIRALEIEKSAKESTHD